MFGTFLNSTQLEEMIPSMPVCLFPPMADRKAWASIDRADREELLALYAQSRTQPYPMLLATQFLAFVRSGSRKAYEDPYFSRRRKLIASVMHMCVTGTREALDDVIDGIWCICEESTWVISAHNVNPHPGAPDAKKKPLPDPDDRYVDLFAAQTAMILSTVSALAGDALDSVSPLLRRRVSREIEQRVLTPFMVRDDFWWMGFIRRDLCNWTPWIVSNILFTAAQQEHDRRRFADLADRALRMLDRWLAVVPQDGGCDEGTAYYNMAGGAMLDCLELMETVTQGKMTFWENEKIRNILSFPLKTQLENGWFVNFADCDAKPFLCGERLQLAGEKIGNDALVRMGSALRGLAVQQIADVPHMTRLLARLFHPAAEKTEPAKAERDVWLPDLQLRVFERGGLILCAKGGHNGESHNHNDVGSFILCVDGEPEILDVGNMVYTSKTFVDDLRYTLFNTRSMNHNLPIIGGCEQRAGAQYRAEAVRCLDNGLALDVAKAYDADAGVSRCARTLTLGGMLTLHDDITLEQEKPVTWVFMLRHEPKISGKEIRFGALKMRCDAQLEPAAESIPVTDARMARNFPGTLYRLTLTAREKARHEATFTIERAEDHE